VDGRHYARKTLKAYADCPANFQNVPEGQAPRDLSSEDVKSYLTILPFNAKSLRRPRTRLSTRFCSFSVMC